MDAQTHRLRNNFILLKNGGKDFDTIVKEMEGVNLKNLNAWEKSLNKNQVIIDKLLEEKEKESKKYPDSFFA